MTAARAGVGRATPRAAEQWTAFAITAPGVAPLAAEECEALGVTVTAVDPAGVTLSVTNETLCRLHCWSRVISRVVVRLASFTARDFATLERRAAQLPWAQFVSAGDALSLSVTCRKSRLYHSDAVAERVARSVQRAVGSVRVVDAAVDDDGVISAPAAHTEASLQRVLVRLDHDACTISIDASGDRLDRRGWRLDSGKAPLRETLAAALLQSSGWTPEFPCIDPLCGAGTIAIEAALRARQIAPGVGRRFRCEAWPCMDAALMARERERAHDATRPHTGAPIVAADRDAGAVHATRTNAERAGVAADIAVLHQPLSEMALSRYGDSGWVVTNPPYGIRTGDPANLKALWGRLGALVRAGGPQWRLAVVVPDAALSRELRLPVRTLVRTTTGGRPVHFMGSRPPRP